jgi:hypothetical protein
MIKQSLQFIKHKIVEIKINLIIIFISLFKNQHE